MGSKIFKRVRKNISEDSRAFIKNSFEIIEQIHEIRKRKKISQKKLAAKLGKTESEISKILSPGHNLTLKTLSKIEVALGEKIIFTQKTKVRTIPKVFVVKEKESKKYSKPHHRIGGTSTKFKPWASC